MKSKIICKLADIQRKMEDIRKAMETEEHSPSIKYVLVNLQARESLLLAELKLPQRIDGLVKL